MAVARAGSEDGFSSVSSMSISRSSSGCQRASMSVTAGVEPGVRPSAPSPITCQKTPTKTKNARTLMRTALMKRVTTRLPGAASWARRGLQAGALAVAQEAADAVGVGVEGGGRRVDGPVHRAADLHLVLLVVQPDEADDVGPAGHVAHHVADPGGLV